SKPVSRCNCNKRRNISYLASSLKGPNPYSPLFFTYTLPFRRLLSLNLGSWRILTNQFLKSRRGTNSLEPWSIKFCKDLSSLTIVQHQQPNLELPVTGILSLSICPITLCSSPISSP